MDGACGERGTWGRGQHTSVLYCCAVPTQPVGVAVGGIYCVASGVMILLISFDTRAAAEYLTPGHLHNLS